MSDFSSKVGLRNERCDIKYVFNNITKHERRRERNKALKMKALAENELSPDNTKNI